MLEKTAEIIETWHALSPVALPKWIYNISGITNRAEFGQCLCWRWEKAGQNSAFS